MNTRLQAIVRRRAALVREIALQRDRSAALLAQLRTQLALAGVALVAGRLLRRSRWARLLALGSAVAGGLLPLAARWLAARR
ncbi:hypothetical protein RAMLITH_08000 [Ramlibacter sp. RBP-2]|uniref:Uncharacterized protein n=1 Tax=Ramlibacter lithotrophicus TaxID=2606681 RepID=A0A7X6DEV1_9BURK|nr:hypothetical protein [Ramlibacter lithotrophicus]NKE65763.1 hypothetical protein [Ramlibacter lithotrophicus]